MYAFFSQWTWSCVNEKCLRRTSPDDRNGVTLNVCNLLCGKYGSLWPKPTGRPNAFKNKINFFDLKPWIKIFANRFDQIRESLIFLSSGQNSIWFNCRWGRISGQTVFAKSLWHISKQITRYVRSELHTRTRNESQNKLQCGSIWFEVGLENRWKLCLKRLKNRWVFP